MIIMESSADTMTACLQEYACTRVPCSVKQLIRNHPHINFGHENIGAEIQDAQRHVHFATVLHAYPSMLPRLSDPYGKKHWASAKLSEDRLPQESSVILLPLECMPAS